MDVIILGAAMPFGPDSLKFRSLGGSETAQLMLGKALAKQGHRVVQVTALPPSGSYDFFPSGQVAADGVRYVSIEEWQQLVCSTPHDLLIISRDLRFANVPHQARHAVFWAHDLATHGFMAPALQQVGWNIDEIWAVSNWHADQIASVTGYPRDRIYATRNGIVDVTDDTVVNPTFASKERDDYTLIYAARPERGLEALLRPGGIMERLPEYKLRISMYAHFPDHMKPLYDWCQSRVAALPNVEYMGSLLQPQMRDEIGAAAAYVYPTVFEETSCILARECIERRTPMITCREGALPETLEDCGVFYTGPHAWNTDEFCQEFADLVRTTLHGPSEGDVHEDFLIELKMNMSARHDLYWDDVAVQMIERVGIYATDKPYSRAWSMVRDGDVLPAIAYLRSLGDDIGPIALNFLAELETSYAFALPGGDLAAHYAMCHDKMAADDPNFQRDQVQAVTMQPRWQAVAAQLAKLPAGSTVLDYGCAEGVQIIAWAKAFPNLRWIGCDFADMAIENAVKHAQTHNMECIHFFNTKEIDLVDQVDAVICTEVLEHQPEPWTLLQKVETYAKPGGRVILTTPFGEYEPDQWEQFNRPWNRQHVWEVDAYAYNCMIGSKQGVDVMLTPGSVMPDGRARGHLVVSYTADHAPIGSIDPLAKALRHNSRQTTTACLIVKNGAATIRKTLDSLKGSVQQIRIIIDGDTNDRTFQIINQFIADNIWLPVTVIRGPAIKPREWGFDDARNLSIDEIETDWFFWIDSDEFLTNRLNKYTRSSAIDSFAIHQHHFTVEPRGIPPQVDRPARLCRVGMKFFGKVHEHAEKDFNVGPGFSMLIQDADIGHVGYENEAVRRSRFERNYPFVEWDREVNPTRKLGAYLWFRDILHRMRYAQEAQNGPAVFALANEAVSFYDAHCEEIMAFGMGASAALGYLAEANRILGRGREVVMQISLDGSPPLSFGGVINETSQLTRVVDKLVGPELEKAKSKYWR